MTCKPFFELLFNLIKKFNKKRPIGRYVQIDLDGFDEYLGVAPIVIACLARGGQG